MTTDHQSQQHTRHPVREALTLALACLAYSVLSFLARASESLALSHAHSIVALERRVGVFIEPSANAWLGAHSTLASLASTQYATTFLLFTGLTLVALWIKAPQFYSRARWTLVVMTLGALATYWSYPLAPPRLVPGLGIADSVAEHTSSYSHLFGTLANPYGAMPSMHTGWSIWVAVSVCFVAGRWWIRVLACSLPVVTVVVIMATANHFVLDAAAGASYYALAFTAVLIATRRRRERAASRLRPTAPPAADSRRSDAPDCPPTRSPNSPA